MSQQVVAEILQKIDTLSEEDRAVLEQELDERAEREWMLLADEARQEARQRGIDQAAIDETIDRLRYPR